MNPSRTGIRESGDFVERRRGQTRGSSSSGEAPRRRVNGSLDALAVLGSQPKEKHTAGRGAR